LRTIRLESAFITFISTIALLLLFRMTGININDELSTLLGVLLTINLVVYYIKKSNA